MNPKLDFPPGALQLATVLGGIANEIFSNGQSFFLLIYYNLVIGPAANAVGLALAIAHDPARGPVALIISSSRPPGCLPLPWSNGSRNATTRNTRRSPCHFCQPQKALPPTFCGTGK